MFSRKLVSSLIVTLIAIASASALSLAPTLEECPGEPAAESRADCVRFVLGTERPSSQEMRRLEDLVHEMPAALLLLTDEWIGEDAGASSDDDRARARMLDLRGRALAQLDRHDEAADAFLDAIALDDGTLRMAWWNADGSLRWERALDTGNRRLMRAANSLRAAGRPEEADRLTARAVELGAPQDRENDGEPLRAPVWFKPVPQMKVSLATGGVYPLNEPGGKALIVSFWASWCEPCTRELPELQALHDELSADGLEVLAVNVGESSGTIAEFTTALGLGLPVGLSNAESESYFKTATLPVTAVIDAEGRVRGRWAGYRPDFAAQIAALARRLLDEERPPARRLAQVIAGAGTLEVAWMREASASVEAVIVEPRGAAIPGVLTTAGRAMILYGKDGETVTERTGPVSVSRLVRAPLDEPGAAALLGYRPGSPSMMLLPSVTGAPKKWTLDDPVFDAGLRSAPTGEDEGYGVIVATLDGLLGAGRPGQQAATLEAAEGGASGVRYLGGGEKGEWAVLGLGGRLIRTDGRGRPIASQDVNRGDWVLVGGSTADSGLGTAPAGLRAFAAGRFLPGGEEQVALATAGGQLLLLDVASGEPRFRARWPGISGLAAGDLFGDSRDELFVIEGKRVVALGATGSSGE
jgi:thiol-disulfide isomerase/thioredoxin